MIADVVARSLVRVAVRHALELQADGLPEAAAAAVARSHLVIAARVCSGRRRRCGRGAGDVAAGQWLACRGGYGDLG